MSREGGGYGNLGNAYQSLGNFQKAIEYHEKDLKIAKEVGDVLEKGGPMATSAMPLTAWATSKRP